MKMARVRERERERGGVEKDHKNALESVCCT